MRRTALPAALAAACLMTLCGSAAADWVYVGGNATTTAYFDPMAMRRSGDGMVQMLSLADLSSPQRPDPAAKPFLSSASQSEFDCGNAEARLVAYRWYAGNMGRGEVVYSDSAQEDWAPVQPGTLFAALLKLACNR